MSAGIDTVGELIDRFPEDLLELPQFGARSLEDVKENLRTLGYSLRERQAVQSNRQALQEAVRDAVTEHSGRAVTSQQVHEGVVERVAFDPAEADVRAILRDLAKSDEQCVKLARDVFAWVLPGKAAPLPPAPPHVVEMIARRWRGLTLDEIGVEFGITRERVRQLLKKHGGPSTEEVRELRAAEAQAAKRDHEQTVVSVIRETLDGRGPMTVAEVVEATGAEAGYVLKFWPQELAHLRLHSTGSHGNLWSDDSGLDAIREAALYEFPLTTNAYADLLAQGQVKGPSMPRILQLYGSWTAACEAAGVVAGQTMRPHYESRWSDDDLLQVARQYLLDPDSPNSAHRFDEWKRASAPDGPSFQTLRNRFGSWTNLKRRALAQGDDDR